MIPVVALAAALATAEGAAPADAVKGAEVVLVQSVRDIAERAAQTMGAKAPLSLLALRADEGVRREQAGRRAERWLPPARAAARGRAWSDLGFGGPGDPAALALALAADLPGMTFDAEGARLLVDPGRLTEEEARGVGTASASLLLATGVAPDEPVVAHYAAHEMLTGAAMPANVTTDALLARAALSEGYSNLAALLLLFAGVGLESEVLAERLTPDDVLGGRLIPDGIRSERPLVAHLVEWVYLDGFSSVAALARRASVPRLPAEIASRATTRDVIHPDRAPAAVAELPEVAPPEGLVVADRDALGEQGMTAWVSRLTGKDNLGMIAGDGWVADALYRFEPAGADAPDTAGVTLWESIWATDDDAKDFAYAVERGLAARFPAEVLAGGPDEPRVLTRADRVYRLVHTGRRVSFRVATPAWDAKLTELPKKKGATVRKGTRTP